MYMSKNNYTPRICDIELQNALDTMRAVLIEGAKWCGKTSTATNVAKSTLFMQDPDKARSYQEMADTKPSLLLKGASMNQKNLTEQFHCPICSIRSTK